MFEGHDPYLVALSVVIAILGGYTGVGLAARIRGTPDAGHRVLLAHPERSPAFQHDPGMLAALVDAGALSSITAASASSRSSTITSRCICWGTS